MFYSDNKRILCDYKSTPNSLPIKVVYKVHQKQNQKVIHLLQEGSVYLQVLAYERLSKHNSVCNDILHNVQKQRCTKTKIKCFKSGIRSFNLNLIMTNWRWGLYNYKTILLRLYTYSQELTLLPEIIVRSSKFNLKNACLAEEGTNVFHCSRQTRLFGVKVLNQIALRYRNISLNKCYAVLTIMKNKEEQGRRFTSWTLYIHSICKFLKLWFS